jgi:hypothetical protein
MRPDVARAKEVDYYDNLEGEFCDRYFGGR